MCIHIHMHTQSYYFNGFRSAYALKGHTVIPAIILISSKRSSKIIVEEGAHRLFLFNYIQHKYILQKLLN